MLRKLLALIGLHTDDGWKEGYAKGYNLGLKEGKDFGSRTVYNAVLKKELADILNRYGKFVLTKLIGTKASAKEMSELYSKFLQSEIERFELELQDR